MNDLVAVQTALTMSSREIADLLGSRHDSVKRSVERLAESKVISFTPSVETSHDGQGARPVEVYRLDKRSSLIVVAQLSPEFTAIIVDRWQELEAQQAQPFKIPTTLSEALRLAADQAETIERQAAQIEQQKPAVEFVERYTEADGSKGFREVCKLLKANEAHFRQFLLDARVMYRLGGRLMPFAQHLEAGRFTVITGLNGENAYTTAKFTSKGITWVAGEWAKHNLAMGV